MDITVSSSLCLRSLFWCRWSELSKVQPWNHSETYSKTGGIDLYFFYFYISLVHTPADTLCNEDFTKLSIISNNETHLYTPHQVPDSSLRLKSKYLQEYSCSLPDVKFKQDDQLEHVFAISPKLLRDKHCVFRVRIWLWCKLCIYSNSDQIVKSRWY